MEAFWGGGDGFDDFIQRTFRDSRITGIMRVGWLEDCRGAAQCALLRLLLAWLRHFVEGGLQFRDEFGFDVGGLCLGDGAESNRFLSEF